MPPTQFETDLRQARSLGLSAPQKISITLTDVVSMLEYNVSGNYFYVLEAPDHVSYIDVQINRNDAPALPYTMQRGFHRQPFNKLYITTPAGQAGIMTIVVAAESPGEFEFIDNRSSISQSMDDVLAELAGDVIPENWGTEKTVGLTAVSALAANADRKAAMVQAKESNTGIIYIGFDNTVTSNKWVAQLQPGMSWSVDDYRGPIFAISDTAAQLLGFGEW